jgi:hypothetical protein
MPVFHADFTGDGVLLTDGSNPIFEKSKSKKKKKKSGKK